MGSSAGFGQRMTRFSLGAALLPFGTLLTGSTIGTNNEKSTKVWTGDVENSPVELITENSQPSGWNIGDIRFTNRRLDLPEWVECANDTSIRIPQDSEYVRTSTIFDGHVGTGDIFDTGTYSSTILCITHIQNMQYIVVLSTNKNNTRYKNIYLYRVKSGYINTTDNITMDDLEQVGLYSEYGSYVPYLHEVNIVQDTLYVTVSYNDYKRMLYIDNTMSEWKYCGNNMYISQLLGPVKIGNMFYITYTTSNNEIHLVASDNMETFYTNGTSTIVGSGLIHDMITLGTKIIILYSSNQYVVYDTPTNTFSSQTISNVVSENQTYSLYQFILAPSGNLYAYAEYSYTSAQSCIFKLQFNPNVDTLTVGSARAVSSYMLTGYCCTSGFIDHVYYPEILYLLCTHDSNSTTPVYGHYIIDTEDNKLVDRYVELETAYSIQYYSHLLDNIGENMYFSNGNHVSVKYINNYAISGLSGGIKHYYLKIN